MLHALINCLFLLENSFSDRLGPSREGSCSPASSPSGRQRGWLRGLALALVTPGERASPRAPSCDLVPAQHSSWLSWVPAPPSYRVTPRQPCEGTGQDFQGESNGGAEGGATDPQRREGRKQDSGTSRSHHFTVPPARASAPPLWDPRSPLQAVLTSWFAPRPRGAGAVSSCSGAHAG